MNPASWFSPWTALSPAVNFVLNHLWQSTLLAGVAALLTLALRKNHAGARYGLWLAASAKFLLPLSLLVGLGSAFGPATVAPAVPMPSSYSVEEIGRNFHTVQVAISLKRDAHTAAAGLQMLLMAIWIGGSSAVFVTWWMRWRRLSSAVRRARPLNDGRELEALHRAQRLAGIRTRIRLASSAASLEPGVYGVFRPVLLLPEGIGDRLSDAQLEAIIAHELCHVRRRDNLAGGLHMIVEAILWFHPLVWWLGARLVTERERACDEEVLRLGSEPEVYAEGILRVCRFYLESPLVCVAGVTGSDLKHRIEEIMTPRGAKTLNLARKLLLAVVGAGTVIAPVMVGLVDTPQGRAQSTTTPATFEVASIKPTHVKGARRIRVTPEGMSLMNVSLGECIETAYGVKRYQINGPDWLATERFDVEAKTSGSASNAQMNQMLQALLADRFRLALHREQKELPVFALVVAKNGPKLQAAEGESEIGFGGNGLSFKNAPISALADFLSRLPSVGRPVLDTTGLKGQFDFSLRTPDNPPEANIADMKRSMRDWPSIFTDVQDQLGLKLEPRKAPLEILMVDHAERIPSEN